MIKRQTFEKPFVAFLPAIFCFAYVLALTLFFKGWTWSLYDELGWIQTHYSLSLKDFIYSDFTTNGRFRPLGPAWIYFKLSAFGLSPHLLRIERVLEVLATAGIFGLFLKRSSTQIKWLFITVGLLFWLKSAPQLDQLRWMFTSETNGFFFFALALFFRKHSKPASYLFLVLMVLAKEPFAIFVPIPALLEKRWKEFFTASAVGFLFLLILSLTRRGYSASYGAVQSFAIVQEILKQGLKDFFYLLPLVFLFTKERIRFFKKQPSTLWPALVFTAFGIVYAGLVFPMLWGYTYMLAPALIMGGIGLTLGLSALNKAQKFSTPWMVFLLLLASLFSLKISYNWTKNYVRNKHLHALFETLNANPKKGPIGTNCPIDNKGIGFATDILSHSVGKVRTNGPSCYKPTNTSRDCCKEAQFLAIGKECGLFEERQNEAEKMKLPLVYSNAGWTLYQCP